MVWCGARAYVGVRVCTCVACVCVRVCGALVMQRVQKAEICQCTVGREVTAQ